MKSLAIFKALADTTRIRLFNILLRHELSVNELVSLLEMGQSRISRHLKILADSGLLNCRRNGVWAFYSVCRDEKTEKLIDAFTSLLDDESELTRDFSRASRIIEERGQRTKQFFNSIAHKWDLLKLDILGDFNLNAAILSSVKPCGCAADLGCGTGELLKYLSDYAQKAVGVDSSSSMLDEARKRFSTGENVELRLGELEHLPMGDGEADLAVISLALHHLSHPNEAVTESRRILSRGGNLVIAEYDRHENETLGRVYGDRWLGFTKQEVKKWLAESGFELMDVKTYPMRQKLSLIIYRSVKK